MTSCCSYVRDTNRLDTELPYYRCINGTQASTGVDQRESRDWSRHHLAVLLELTCQRCWNLNLDGDHRARNLKAASKWLRGRGRILLGLVAEVIERRQ